MSERIVSPNANKGYTVVSGGGAFKKGAQFLLSQFDASLKMGVWPDGMVVRKNGKKYIVRHVVSYVLMEEYGYSLRKED